MKQQRTLAELAARLEELEKEVSDIGWEVSHTPTSGIIYKGVVGVRNEAFSRLSSAFHDAIRSLTDLPGEPLTVENVDREEQLVMLGYSSIGHCSKVFRLTEEEVEGEYYRCWIWGNEAGDVVMTGGSDNGWCVWVEIPEHWVRRANLKAVVM